MERRILKTARHYKRLTVRQLYYILISRYRYTPTRTFYKVLDYHLTKMRRLKIYQELHEKFVDPSRHFVPAPLPYREIELWVEKDSIRNFLEDLAAEYRLLIQVLRGFASLTMYRVALRRAAKRGVRKILYAGDFDPSGLQIEKVAEKEMDMEFKRIALTMEQIKKYRPTSIPVNRRDSRAKEYVKQYGDRCWELEALRPRTLLKVVEQQLKENVPHKYLIHAEARERAARVARPVMEKLRRIIEGEVHRLLEEGKSEEQILAHISAKYGPRRRRRQIRSNEIEKFRSSRRAENIAKHDL